MFIISLFIVLASTVMASTTYTWEDCVRMALDHNADIKGAEANLEASISQKKTNIGDFLPQLSANVGVTENSVGSSSVTGGGAGSSVTSGARTYNATLSGNMNLFNGFQDLAQWDAGQANVEIARATLKSVKAKVSFELKSAFENVLYGKEFMKLASEIAKRREENYKLVQLRYQSGRENKGSLFLAEAYLNQANYDFLVATNAKKTALINLARAIGIDSVEEYDVTGEIPLNNPESAPDLKNLALHTPSYLQAKGQVDAQEANLKVARSEFYPNLDLSGNVGRQGPDFFPERERWSVALNLSFPFFVGGKDYFASSAASSTLTAAKYSRQNALRQAYASLQQYYAPFLEAVTKLKVDASFKNAVEVRAEIARKKYNNGLLTFEDWDVIENDLISRQKNYLSTKRDRVIAEAQWEQTQGKGILE